MVDGSMPSSAPGSSSLLLCPGQAKRRRRHQIYSSSAPACLASLLTLLAAGSASAWPSEGGGGMLASWCEVLPPVQPVTEGRAHVAISGGSNNNGSTGPESMALEFAAGDDLDEVAAGFVSRAGLSSGGGCEDAACVARMLREVVEAEALRLPAFQPALEGSSPGAYYSAIADTCFTPQPALASPPSFSASSSTSPRPSAWRHLLSLLDQASLLLPCPAPSFYLHHYALHDDLPPSSSPSDGPDYPRLCHLGPSSYRDCACVLMDRIAANLLLLHRQQQQQQQDGESEGRSGVRLRLLLTLVKDVATLLASISGATELSVPLSSVSGPLSLLSVQLLEEVLHHYPRDIEARLLAGHLRLLLGHPDQAALHYSFRIPPAAISIQPQPSSTGTRAGGERRVLKGLFRLSAGLPLEEEEGQEVLGVSLLKVSHDRQQLEWLLDRALLPELPYRAVAQEYGRLEDHLRQQQAAGGGSGGSVGGGGQLQEEVGVRASSFPLVAGTYRRMVYLAPTPALPEGALSEHWDGAEVEAVFAGRGQEVAVVDGALRGAALQSLLTLCTASTVFHEARANGYLGAYSDVTGFASGLLLQVAIELQQRLSRLLGRHRIRRVWAYKYDQNYTGISPHADDSSVTVNCWITPDEAVTQPGRGGMAMFKDVRIPSHWSYTDYTDPAKVTSLLLSHPTGVSSAVLIPFRQNRCVVFRSAIVHQSDNAMPFRQGYTNRRINLTFLYGAMFDN